MGSSVNIEIVTIFVLLFFGLPLFWYALKSGLFKSFSFFHLIKILNKSLRVQVIIGLMLMLLTWIWNAADFKFGGFLTGTTYTYLVIGFFMYLPAMGILNLIGLIVGKKIKKEGTE